MAGGSTGGAPSANLTVFEDFRRRAVLVADASVPPTDTPTVDTDRIQYDANNRVFNCIYSVDTASWHMSELGTQGITIYFPRGVASGTAFGSTVAGAQTLYWDPFVGGAPNATQNNVAVPVTDVPTQTSVLIKRFEVQISSNTLDTDTVFSFMAGANVRGTITVPAGQTGFFASDDVLGGALAGTGTSVAIRGVLGGTGAQAIGVSGFVVEVYRA